MKPEQTERTTKRREQILEAAFGLSARRGDWSLADVAGEIGLSKTALYRHFRDRAEIEEEMRRDLFRSLLRVIEASDASPALIRKAVVSFFREHQGHLYVTLMGLVTDPTFSRTVIEFLVSGSERIARYFARASVTEPATRERVAADLLINSVSILLASFLDEHIDTKLQDGLLDLLEQGFEGMRLPTEERLDELTVAAGLADADIERDEGKILSAIARVIRLYGLTKTTIGRIAEETGTAKSSLYFHYKTKEDMLEDLLRRETGTLVRLFKEKAAVGETFTEQLYVIMVVQANYLVMKPDFIPVFNWIRYETIVNRYDSDHGRFDVDDLLSAFRTGDLSGGREPPERGSAGDAPCAWDTRILAIALIKWASIISSTVTIYGYDTGHDPDKIRKNVRTAFMRMVLGEKEL